jgi:SWI/SNF-related matrix-associated actin-dependent regulator of chromatin subfamily A member 5
MGLGKTLQTLSLIQHLKENDPKVGIGRQQRPFLVICPLSVLSSWMAEARKWAPKLKVIRFHGPMKERDRLKKVISGELDFYGNMTAQAKAKLKIRVNARGKKVISLDTDSEDEDDIGVDVVVTTYGMSPRPIPSTCDMRKHHTLIFCISMMELGTNRVIRCL